MDEDQYRQTYHSINRLRCVFEKSINSRQTKCHLSHRFCLADREGVACTRESAQTLCRKMLDELHQRAMFALKLTKIDGELPHGKEIKIQTGGVLGVRELLEPDTRHSPAVPPDIHALFSRLTQIYQPDALPYDVIVRHIVHYEGRPKRRRSKGR